ncbi:cupin domain-containing protein [Eubacteriaceae bacterium ES3]|nr:cupin domain-containing protein [Eubacteriaceae bacterium ES3]
MIFKKEMLKKEVRSNMRGGSGEVALTHLADEMILGKNCRLFSKTLLKPGDSIGDHPHHGEKEIYVFLKGQGLVTDDDKEVAVFPGDVMVTPDGHSHSVLNTGDEDLEFIALILKDSIDN